mmetsp:Transcript_2843/g.4534  ORF Transcript_2843/g.4534 Transcript_2843/m.4534 type:complete len:194 (+) Transcript_2843:1-582(+)
MVTSGGDKPNVSFSKLQHYQFVASASTNTQSAIVSMAYMEETNQLVVSTRAIPAAVPVVPVDVTSVRIPVPVPQAVQVLKVEESLQSPMLFATLDGHKDFVQCLIPLPNGCLLTAGGKNDATMKIWELGKIASVSTDDNLHSAPVMSNPSSTIDKDGYIFAGAVLKDFKSSNGEGSRPFALAVARYNVVKILC